MLTDSSTQEDGQLPSMHSLEVGGRISSAVSPPTTPIQLSDHHLLTILQGIGQAVHCFTLTGVITYWNKAAEQLYGWQRSEAIGANIVTLVCQGDVHRIAEQILTLVGHGETWSGQFPLQRRNGEKFIANVTDSPMYNDKGEVVGVIGVVSDSRRFAEIGNRVTNKTSILPQLRFSQGENFPPGPEGWIPRPPVVLVSPLASALSSIGRRFKKLSLRSEKRSEEDRSQAGSPPVSLGIKREEYDVARPSSSNPGLPLRQLSLTSMPFRMTSNSARAALDAQSVRSADRKLEGLGDWISAREQQENAQVVAWEPMNAEEDRWCRNASGPRLSEEAAERLQRDGGGWDGPTSEATSFSYNSFSTFQDGSEDLWAESESGAVESEERTVPSEISLMRESSSSGSEDWIDWEIQWEELTINEVIGQGGSGTVFRASWNGSDVAVKLYGEVDSDNPHVEDFRKELQVMRRLRHPNLLLFMGAVTTQGRLALVTEYLPRGSLWKLLHRKEPELDYKRRLQIALDVARGMTHLHKSRSPIIHRDLKSSNLLVTSNWSVKIGDFGLSRVKNSAYLTASSGRGTPQWMAPEMLRSEPLTEKCDVYSFGVILWELLTSKAPWENMHPMQVVGAVGFQGRTLPLPSNADPRLIAIIEWCWNIDPRHRPSFEELTESLLQLQVRDSSLDSPSTAEET